MLTVHIQKLRKSVAPLIILTPSFPEWFSPLSIPSPYLYTMMVLTIPEIQNNLKSVHNHKRSNRKQPLSLPLKWIHQNTKGCIHFKGREREVSSVASGLSGEGIWNEYLRAPHPTPSAWNTEAGKLYFLWVLRLKAACFQMNMSLPPFACWRLNAENDTYTGVHWAGSILVFQASLTSMGPLCSMLCSMLSLNE